MRLRTQVFVSHSEPQASKIEPVTNERFWKPAGGMWTSTLNDQGGEWVEWLKGERLYEDARWGGTLWLLEPADAKVCVIQDPADLWRLHKRHPLRVPELAGVSAMDALVDWEAVAREYDAVHIPDPWSHRFGGDYRASMFFYVMDAECTCWFRWCFEGAPVVSDSEMSLR